MSPPGARARGNRRRLIMLNSLMLQWELAREPVIRHSPLFSALHKKYVSSTAAIQTLLQIFKYRCLQVVDPGHLIRRPDGMDHNAILDIG